MTVRRRPAALAVVALALSAVACGDDEAATPAPTATLPPVADTTVPDDGGAPAEPPREYAYPTGADEVVISYAEVGGFTTAQFAFQQPPRTLISGDRLSFEPGAEAAVFPGPLLPTLFTREISDLGVQRVLAAAEAAGLFADIDYEAPTNIADAPTAVVTINVDGDTWVHEAYALGFDAGPGSTVEESPERQALFDFTLQLSDLGALAGEDELGESEFFEPEAFEIVALDLTDGDVSGGDPAPTVVAWPADASVRLADASECTQIDDPAVAEIFRSSDELTYFTEDDRTYEVLVRPVLPGSEC